MTKSTRVLSGTAKNVFLEGVVRSAVGDDHEARERLLKDLTEAIASLRVRIDAERGRRAISDWTERVLSIAETAAPDEGPEASASSASPIDALPATVPPDLVVDDSTGEFGEAAFDPYDPNVIVVLRTKGREAALQALSNIAQEANLRLLAREQQLGIPGDASSLSAIRDAIVTAAERRIANRRAAGS